LFLKKLARLSQPTGSLSENEEIKRLLLEVIPPENVAEVLQLKVIDSWQGPHSFYELVEAGNNPYPSRYRAIRCKCPSTNKPYLLRTHPDMTSAERAVVELNGGIHPTSFSWEH